MEKTRERKSGYKDYIAHSFEEALSRFKETEEYRLLDKRCEEAERALQDRFSEDDYHFTTQMMDAYIMQAEEEGRFLYRQGYRDCVNLLKQLGILG